MKEIIHFAHGNGFPSPCYQQMLKILARKFDYLYIDRLGHNEDFPVTDNWENLVDEVIDSIESQTQEKVIGLGHSLGGVLTLLAAIAKPQLFKMVIMLDSPLLNRIRSTLLFLSKKFGIVDILTPAFRTKNRREYWNTREDAISYLQHKALFRYFTQECLNDYIDYGMEHNENGYALRFDPEIEYKIYRTIPHSLYTYENQLKLPAAVIFGTKSWRQNVHNTKFF